MGILRPMGAHACTHMHIHTHMHTHIRMDTRDVHPRPRAGPRLCDFSLTWSSGPASEVCAEDKGTLQRGRGPWRGPQGPGRRAGWPPAHPPLPRQGASARPRSPRRPPPRAPHPLGLGEESTFWKGWDSSL